MDKTDSQQFFNYSIQKVYGPLHIILLDILLLEKEILIKMVGWNV